MPHRVLESVFKRGGMTVLSKSRAEKVERAGDGVLVTLADGRDGRGQPLPHGGRLDPEHRRHRARGGRACR